MKLRTQLILLFIATLICYANTWKNSFVYDDHVYIEQNKCVTGPLDLKKIFTSSYPPDSSDQGLYRPLLVLSYKLNQLVFGFPQSANPFNGFHFINTLAHLACVILFLFLLRRLGFENQTAFLAALLFATYPTLSESVNWVVGRAEIGAALWTLVALHLWICSKNWLRLLSPLAWFAALLFKESAIMAPFLALLLQKYRPQHFPTTKRFDRVLLSILGISLLGIYVGLRSIALPSLTPAITPFTGTFTFLERICTAITVLWKYLFYVFIPIPLSVYHDVKPVEGPTDFRFILACVGWGLLLWGLWKWRNQTRAWRFGLLWWLTALIPASNLIVPIGTLFAERFLYLPSLFLYVALAENIRVWTTNSSFREFFSEKTWRKVALVLILAFGFFELIWLPTLERNSEWKNDLTLWKSALNHYPNSFSAAAPYASALAKDLRFEEAMRYLKQSEAGIKHGPKIYQQIFKPKLEELRSQIQYGLDRQKYFKEMTRGKILVLSGQPRAALKILEFLALKYPQFSEAEESIADIYFRLGNPMAALQHYQKATVIRPNAILYGKMAQTMARMGAPNQAIEMYERSLVLDPKNPITNYNLAILWNDIKQIDKSIFYLERAIQAYPEFIAARINLASCYEKKGRKEDALAQLQSVLTLDPQNAEAQKLMRKLTKKPSLMDQKSETPEPPKKII